MKRRFIALIDFSDHSEWLLSFSYKWAREADAELLLIHRSTDMLPGLGDSTLREEMRRENTERSIAMLRYFVESKVGSDVTIKYHAEFRNIAAAILELQQPGITDYIFVGVNDRSQLENFVIGGTALRLTDEINNIIIALPASRQDFQLDTLYVGIKHTYPLKEAGFLDLLAIKRDMIGEVRFFSVIKPQSPREKAENYLKSICIQYEKQVPVSWEILENEDTERTITEYMHANNGILVVQKGSRSLMDMFRRFFTTEIIHHAHIPVIILP